MFGTGPVPAALVPILLPSTTGNRWLAMTPLPLLPETRFPSPAPVPPNRRPGAFRSTTADAWPAVPLGTAAVPAALVPIRLPWMVPGRAVLRARMVLPEMRFPAPAAEPPTIGSGPPASVGVMPSLAMSMPDIRLAIAAVPARLVPILLPWTTTPALLSVISMPRSFPDTRLPAPAAVPPIVAETLRATRMPRREPGMAAVPAALVPITLPRTVASEMTVWFGYERRSTL